MEALLGIGFWQLLILLVIVLIFLAIRRRFSRDGRDVHSSRPRSDLRDTTVYPAGTAQGKDADSSSYRLPKRELFIASILLAAIAALGAAVWWFAI